MAGHEWGDRFPDNAEVGGSIPPSPTPDHDFFTGSMRQSTSCTTLHHKILGSGAEVTMRTMTSASRRPDHSAASPSIPLRPTVGFVPTVRQAFGIGPDTAAEILVMFGDNPERFRSDDAFAKLCGGCPIPASSGMTAGCHRLYTGGHRQPNAALYRSRHRQNALSRTHHQIHQPPHCERPRRTRNHPLIRTFIGLRDLPARHDRALAPNRPSPLPPEQASLDIGASTPMAEAFNSLNKW